MKVSHQFTEGKIYRPLIAFAIPVFFALLLQSMYGAVDMLVVGRFSTAAQVSAVSTGSWVMQAIYAAITGLAMGTTIMLGHKIGEKKAEEGGRVVGSSLFLFVILGAIVTILVLLVAPGIATIMQCPKEAYDSTVSYMRICAVGTLLIVGYNVLGSILRGVGNSVLPLISVAIACVFNIAGDLLFVAGFQMGASGAALATVLAQAISVLISLLILRKQQLPFKIKRDDFCFDRENIKQVVKLGFPIALQDILVSISFLVITAIVNTLGVIPSAGVGVAEKICGFVMLVPSAFSQSMSAFVSQNMGAQKPERAKKGLIYAIGTSLAIGVLIGYAAFFHGDLMASIFSGDHQVVLAAADYLKAYAIDCIFTSFLFCFIGYFNGCGKTTFVMIQGIIGAFAVRIPVAFLMSHWNPVSLFHVGLATPCSSIVQILLCFGYLHYVRKQELKHLNNNFNK